MKKRKIVKKILCISLAALMLGAYAGTALPQYTGTEITANAEEDFIYLSGATNMASAKEVSLDKMYASTLKGDQTLYFKFKTPKQKGYFDIYAMNINIPTHPWSSSDQVRFTVTDRLGEEFLRFDNTVNDFRSQNMSLKPSSEYYIVVHNYYGGEEKETPGNFKFKISYTADKGGDTKSDATKIKLVTKVSGTLDGDKDIDCYKFTTDKYKKYTLSMTNINIPTHSWSDSNMFYVQIRSSIDETLLDLRAVTKETKIGKVDLQPNTTYYIFVKEPWESGKGNYTFTVSPEKTSITDAAVSYTKSFKYTGKEIKPSVTVKYSGKTLKQGTDYTVSYSNNIKSGTGTITIKGIGEYKGTVTNKFNIIAPTAPKDNGSKLVDNAGVGGGSMSTWVNWNNITAKANFKGEGGWKYKYSYKNDKDNKWVDMTGYVTSSSYRLPKFTKAGNYTIRIAATDKYGQYASKYTFLTVKQNTNATLKNSASKLSSTNVSKGQTITASAKFTGGVIPYRYKYAYKKDGGAWVEIKQPKHDNAIYSTDDNFSFKLPSQSGRYTVKIVCRDGAGKTASKDITVTVR